MEDFVAYVEEALSDQLVPIEVEIPFTNGEEVIGISPKNVFDEVIFSAHTANLSFLHS
jgi:hypothetical protein